MADQRIDLKALRVSSLRGYLFVLIAVFFWGGSASLAKYLFITKYDALIISQTRSSLSFVLFFSYFLLRDRTVFKIDKSDLLKFVFLGFIGIASTNFTYYWTVKESTVAMAILVQYTAPVLVMLYAVGISREESLSAVKLLSLILSLVGCFFAVSGGSISEIKLSGSAIVSGPASAFGFAYMILASKHLLKKYSAWTTLVYAFGFATLFWLMVNPPWAIMAHGYTWSDWGVFWIFALVSILIPHTLFTFGLRLLEASRVSIASTLEPVVAIVVAYLALGERMNGVQILGATGVVAGIILLQVPPEWNSISKVNDGD